MSEESRRSLLQHYSSENTAHATNLLALALVGLTAVEVLPRKDPWQQFVFAAVVASLSGAAYNNVVAIIQLPINPCSKMSSMAQMHDSTSHRVGNWPSLSANVAKQFASLSLRHGRGLQITFLATVLIFIFIYAVTVGVPWSLSLVSAFLGFIALVHDSIFVRLMRSR
jgi:hypothetical protein